MVRWGWGLYFFTFLSAQPALEKKFASSVSQHNLQQTVHQLVQCGNRLGGTASGDKSARTIAGILKQYGLQTEILEDPAKPSYTALSWRMGIESPKSLRGLIQHEWLALYSPSSPERVMRLTLASSANDVDAGHVDSGAVLVEGKLHEKLYRALAHVGARCILCYENLSSTAYLNWAKITALPAEGINPIPVFNISKTAGVRLRKELENSQIVFIRCSSKTTIVSGRAKSVVATIQGQSDDYVIVCAHGDSDAGGPGADDNASGVSCVLELARILQSMVKTKALPVPKYTIKFIAWGSEYASTEQYVKGHAGALNRIRAVINYDELGAGTPRSCLYFEGNNVPQNYELLKMFERVGDEYAAKRGFWNEATTNPTQDGTDAYVFYPDYLKKLDLPPATIPSITVFTAAWNETKTMAQTAGWQSKAWKGNPDSVIISYSPYYHSSLDIPVLTTDKEPQKMMWGVRSVGIVLLRWLWN